ncbi:MAG: hypothetical protein HYZ32_03795 [Hydrocarboniphaga effusa]|nr:hypothetical protein [Hydrocarboniphaga effusa]
MAAITVASVVVGAALYRLIEVPFMRLRDRRFPGNFVRQRAGRAFDAGPGAALPE